MRLKKLVLASLAVSALAVNLGLSPAQGQEKGPVDSPTAGAAEPDAGTQSPAANRGAEAARNAIQANIARWVEKNGPKHSFATYLDSSSGRVVVKTDAPGRVVSSLVGNHADKVDVAADTTSDLYNRRDDIPSYYGGAGITATTGTPWCSSGFTVKNSVGTRFMTTAGHCFSNGTAVKTELGGRAFGTVSSNGLSSGFDMERIGGQSYWHYIYVGDVYSSTGIPVVSAGDAFVGYANYCHSGRTTGEHCGHKAIDNYAQVCTQSGCKYPVTAFNGGTLPQGGDSGSPFYVKDSSGAWIRGMVIAGNGTTSYAEKYSRIASHLGVSIVTG